MDKILINHSESFILDTSVGTLHIKGNNVITKVTEEQFNALMAIPDFKIWVDKGYILVDAPLNRTNDVVEAIKEQDINKQENDAALIRLEALTEAIMANEGITDIAVAEEEARKRLAEEAEKAEMAGDDDAEELKKASKAKRK